MMWLSRCRLPTGQVIKFPIDEFARQCLLDPVDESAYR